MNKKTSLETNMLLSTINRIAQIIFPLITFPYASRILGVENMGKFSFSSTFVNYFALIAALGINNYAIREGAKVRSNPEKLRNFADQIFTINMMATLSSYILLILTVLFLPSLNPYIPTLSILAVNTVFITFGIEWMYNVYEDYAYITFRNIVLRLISLVLLFALVRDTDDLLIYTAVSVFAGIGTGILNYQHAKKYHQPRLCRPDKVDYKRHMPPILVLFATAVAITIYVNSDITILGVLCGDYHVGIYSASTKVYSTLKTIPSAIIVVTIPHLSAVLSEKGASHFQAKASEVYSQLITFLFPVVIMALVLRKEFILLMAGEAYLEAIPALVILCFSVISCICGWFWGQCILIPLNKEKIVLYATLTSAVTNILLNFLLIPLWGVNAAAFTTFLSETIQCIWPMTVARKYVKTTGVSSCLCKTLLGSLIFLLADLPIRALNLNYGIHTLAVVLVSLPLYVLSQVALKNPAITKLFPARSHR